MKNFAKWIGIIALTAVIAVPAFARGSRDRSGAAPGQLTITGLDKYNGLFIKAGYYDTDGEQVLMRLDAGSRPIQEWTPVMNDTIFGGVIENGMVTLNIWNTRNPVAPAPYRPSGEMTFYVSIWDTDGGEIYHWHFNKASGDVTARFTNGTGRGVFVEDN